MFLGKNLKSPLKNASTYDGNRKYLRYRTGSKNKYTFSTP